LIEELRNELNRVKTDRKEQQEMWETQTMALMKDLTNRVDKVVELEIALDEVRDKYSQLLNNSENQKYLRRITFLEKNLQQITQSFQEIYSENNKLRIQLKLVSKLELRDTRIESCDRQLQELTRKNTEQVNEYLEKIRHMKRDMDATKMENQKLNKIIFVLEHQRSERSSEEEDDDEDYIQNKPHRIVRPLRGGGKREVGPPPPVVMARPTHVKLPSQPKSNTNSPTTMRQALVEEEKQAPRLMLQPQQHKRRLSISGMIGSIFGLGSSPSTPSTPSSQTPTATTTQNRRVSMDSFKSPNTPSGKISMKDLAGGYNSSKDILILVLVI
jgi:cytochrome oxidase Cu insertion factor (SCO1/SenC/PrrC family)